MIENVGQQKAVYLFRGFVPEGCIQGQPVDLLVDKVALVAGRIDIHGEIDLPDALGVCRPQREGVKEGVKDRVVISWRIPPGSGCRRSWICALGR